jgi:4-alpha-glucanotransferase
MLDPLWRSVADTTIVQTQDLLGLGSEARMNQPSTMGKNWKWRVEKGALSAELAEKIRRKMKIYGRLD